MLAYTIGPTELLIVLFILVLLFGAKKLPDLARSIGKSTSEFKKGVKDAGVEDTEDAAPDTPAEKKTD